MRRPIRKPRTWKPDLEYKSEGVARFINAVMWDGKKDTARRVVYDAFSKIKEGGANPLETFEAAIRNASPLMEVRSRRVGGANYQVPREVPQNRRLALAYRWLIGSARSKKGRPMADKLAEELSLAAKNEGEAIKKKDEMHRMAEANKAFAHFAW
ncbi:30S ribosomal protein S7 [Candidatus Kaiserbacteria bacterium RIFCSPLOWO2_02_FULL_56_11]|uniref:Small ribosomal subunit protein uS7 n=2 Tax=Candidatus Kaiseribacteriota TaxID=1752734 RepID=A0A1F6E4W7_9BACT|nr:MAG: 30S ribosomal protein S7 [Candidatus Kaiserbacteria bacterium RIFCSPHIGHO2_02_FULL_56_30]OGG72405.1 MAG: 30S ribosomal protein S7 [Candidatus Kaiserbacteria bacterium RIFCSPHIGHO2_12_FULL_56_13]OGG81605.1 MAG: 30S ribosomal protein S7 [Candidatus Kaiserbacteria bacterium RIFCSPLOWO2_02_FULL_56_11]